MRVSLLSSVVAAVGFFTATASYAQGFVEQTVNLSVASFAAMVATIVVGVVLSWVATRLAALAAPSLAKDPSDRTLKDIAVIEANKRIQALDRQQLYDFVNNEVAAHSRKIITSPNFDPVREADAILTGAMERFKSRNPELADKINITPQDMADLITSGFGKAQIALLANAPKSVQNVTTEPNKQSVNPILATPPYTIT